MVTRKYKKVTLSVKILLIFSVWFSVCITAQTKDSILSVVSPNIFYISDAGRNFSGGIKTGNAYMGMVNLGLNLHSDKLWEGGTLYAEIKNTHGENLSENFIGDMQIVSNIENGNYTFLSQLYFVQKFKKLKLLAGVHDLNTEFVTCDHACALTNSSFGIPSTFPLNFQAAIYPKPALAVIAAYDITKSLNIRTAFYDGDAGTLDDDPYNLSWGISLEKGVLGISEITFNPELLSLKFGFYYHSGKFTSYSNSSESEYGNYGVYLISEKEVFKTGNKAIGIFNQISYAPGIFNYNNLYFGAGAVATGFLTDRFENRLSLGLAYARNFNDNFEYDIECNFQCRVSKHFHIQPCVHFIMHPGANSTANTGFAAFLRTSLYL